MQAVFRDRDNEHLPSSEAQREQAAVAALPKVGGGLLATIMLSVLTSLLYLIGPGLSVDLLIHIPMQLYWTFCLMRVSWAVGTIYGERPPLSQSAILLISFFSFVLLPYWHGYHGLRFMDPSFYLWLLTQSWPVFVGAYIAKKESGSDSKKQLYLPAALAFAANAYVIAWAVAPSAFTPAVFNFCWFITQFWCIHFICARVRSTCNQPSKLIRKKEELVVAGNDVVLRYRAHAAIERWIQQRVREGNVRSAFRTIILWLVGPLITLGCLVWLCASGDAIFGRQTAQTAGALAAGAAAAGANLAFLQWFTIIVSAMMSALVLTYLKEPTHIGVSADGMRFLWRRKFFKQDGKYLSWDGLTHVGMLHPAGKTSPLDNTLTFTYENGRKVQIKMGSIDSVDHRESLLNAIQKWAPNVERDSDVIQALQPPADHSYTELWLQALSAPPKRERLQPLIAGAVLKERAYSVIHSIGTGGQGQAYLATDSRNGQSVVLKEFILPVYVDITVRKSALEQFENEARILRQLDNPQIVHLIDFFIEDHRAYLVLEHIKGASLREIVKNKGRLPEAQVRELALQMCDILQYLHGLTPPVVHRDFTPDNLILKVDGTLKLIDFNVAKQVVESTTSGTVVGKHAYLPPEQFRGLPVPESDIYALGATVHYLLTGVDPEPIAVSHPRRLVPELSEQLNAVVEKATALDVNKRYRSPAELRGDL